MPPHVRPKDQGRVVASVFYVWVSLIQTTPELGKELGADLMKDGGGVRGLSSLYILQRLMYRIRPEDDLEKLPKPCDVFDVIVGTSTGGLIAIMLGLLVSQNAHSSLSSLGLTTCIHGRR
jgi:hypothetical protein